MSQLEASNSNSADPATDYLLDKLSAEEKESLEQALTALRTAHSNKDFAEIEKNSENLNQIFHKLAEKMYANPAAEPASEPSTATDTTQEAEEVK